MDSQGVDHPNPEQRWRWRRRIALISLTAGLVYPLFAGLAAVLEPRVSATLSSIAWPVYTMLMGNIGGYIGTAAWEHIRTGVTR